MKTRIGISVLLVVLIGAAAFFVVERAEAPENDLEQTEVSEATATFTAELEAEVRSELGQPIEGYEPFMFMEVFEGLRAEDFDGVDASIGTYVYTDGALEHDLEGVKQIHSAAGAITENGMATLFQNVSHRLLRTEHADADAVVSALKETGEDQREAPGDAEQDGDTAPPVACTADAKLCPDGSAVGRTGPNCEFATCPASPSRTYCSDEMKQVDLCTQEYQPVCGLVETECESGQCEPKQKTFGNDCMACVEEGVVSYTEGKCTI